VHCFATSVMSDHFPGAAIDLEFDIDDARVPRLSSWSLRKREATEFYLPVTAEEPQH
jgi:hypothetical protein